MEPKKELDQLKERLEKSFGNRLVSVILYGSAAAEGEFHAGFSDLNVLCVLTKVDTTDLVDYEPIARWWREKDYPEPLLMAEPELAGSTDCFPIEFKDMQERRQVLFGKDVIAPLAVDERYYRAQLEHELRSKLLRLRQRGAAASFDPKLLLRLMVDSVTTFLVLARHGLILAGVACPYCKRDTIEKLGQRFGMDTQPFTTLLDFRSEKLKASDVNARTLFSEYLKGVEALVGQVDLLGRSEG